MMEDNTMSLAHRMLNSCRKITFEIRVFIQARVKRGKLTGILLLLPMFFPLAVTAQDTLTLSREQCEAIFLEENLILMAEKMNIDRSEAMVLQASLWPNPTLEIEELNLWTAQKGINNRSYFGDELPGFGNGNFGKNQQISVSIEQLIQTAGKRKKLVAVEQVSVDQSRQYFEEVLRNLKVEFRQQLTHLQYLQQSKIIYQNQIQSVNHLTQAFQRQVERGHIPQGEYVRLKALELEISSQINAMNTAIYEAQKELKLLMGLPPDSYLEITPEGFAVETGPLLILQRSELIEEAKLFRPDYKSAELEQTYYDKLYAYEKARRVPDFTLKAGYDRGGNFIYNFLGLGVEIELPFFDRNQGNIQAARVGRLQSDTRRQHKELSIENEVVLAHQSLLNSIQFMNHIEPGYEDSLDGLLARYTDNFAARNISMLEYLDFMEAYLENKKIILEARKEVIEKLEELNYTVGREVTQ